MTLYRHQYSLRSLFVLTSVLALVLGLYIGISSLFRDYSDVATGSPDLAAKWKAAFEGIDNPEDAQAAFPEVAVRRFTNGEWWFGISRDSHRYPDGGTVVFKDSTGKVRAFFGHVCGSRALECSMPSERRSLDDFYRACSGGPFQYKEYTFP